MKPWTQLIVGLLIAICSTSLGYGISQTTLTRQVVTNTERVGHLETIYKQLREDMVEMRRSHLEAMKSTVSLFQETLKLTQEVLKQSQIQSALLERAYGEGNNGTK